MKTKQGGIAMIYRRGFAKGIPVLLAALLLTLLFLPSASAEVFDYSKINAVSVYYMLDGESEPEYVTTFPISANPLSKAILLPEECDSENVTIVLDFLNDQFYGVLDVLKLGGKAPNQCLSHSDPNAVKKVSDQDFDVLQTEPVAARQAGPVYPNSFAFQFEKGGRVLELTARSESNIFYYIPFVFPESNRIREEGEAEFFTPDSEFYQYELGSGKPMPAYDEQNPPDFSGEKPFLELDTIPTTGHPVSKLKIYVTHDNEYLYIYADALSDNTEDGWHDYFCTYFRLTGSAAQPGFLYIEDGYIYKDIQEGDDEGIIPLEEGSYSYFQYSGSKYQHVSYVSRFQLPDPLPECIDLGFKLYGTAAVSEFTHEYRDYHLNYQETQQVYLIDYVRNARAGGNVIMGHETFQLEDLVQLCSDCLGVDGHTTPFIQISGNRPGTDILLTYDMRSAFHTSNLYVYATVKSFAVDYDRTSLAIGQSLLPECKLELSHTPMVGDDLNLFRDGIIFESSDPDIVEVDKATGRVMAKKPGKTVVSAVTEADRLLDGIFSPAVLFFEFTVSEEGEIPVTGLTVNPSELTIYIGDSSMLTAEVLPDNASDQTIRWSSSDETIASVDQNGRITGKKAGKVTITAATVDGGFSDTCEVTVLEKSDPAPTSEPTPAPSPTAVPDSPKTGDAGPAVWTVPMVLALAALALVHFWSRKQNQAKQ